MCRPRWRRPDWSSMFLAAVVLLVVWWELRKLSKALDDRAPTVSEHIVYLAPLNMYRLDDERSQGGQFHYGHRQL